MSLGRQFDHFVPPDSQWAFRNAPEPIDAAVDSYPQRIKSDGSDTEAAPYNRASMAEIYHPRVSNLLGLQQRGFTHAAWGRLGADRENRWHGTRADAPVIRTTSAMTPVQAKKSMARFVN